jgi:hypothetical protein
VDQIMPLPVVLVALALLTLVGGLASDEVHVQLYRLSICRRRALVLDRRGLLALAPWMSCLQC